MDGIIRRDGVDYACRLRGDNGIMANPFEETLQAGTINPREQAAESMMQVGIGSLGDRPSPNYGNLPETFQGDGNMEWSPTPIFNLPFYPQEELYTTNEDLSRRSINPSLKGFRWDQKNLFDLQQQDNPYKPIYQNKPEGWFPPRHRKSSTNYEGDPLNILSYMDQLRSMGEMDFLGSMDQVYQMDEPSSMEKNIFETPGRQMEGIPQDYSHIADYYDYLNTLPVDQLQGIESIMDAARLNAGREKKLNTYWWQRSDI